MITTVSYGTIGASISSFRCFDMVNTQLPASGEEASERFSYRYVSNHK